MLKRPFQAELLTSKGVCIIGGEYDMLASTVHLALSLDLLEDAELLAEVFGMLPAYLKTMENVPY